MLYTSQLATLAERKRLLVAESELNRQAIASDISALNASLGAVRGVFGSSRALALASAGAAGLLFATRGKGVLGLVSKAVSAWRLWQTLKPLWEKFRPSISPAAD